MRRHIVIENGDNLATASFVQRAIQGEALAVDTMSRLEENADWQTARKPANHLAGVVRIPIIHHDNLNLQSSAIRRGQAGQGLIERVWAVASTYNDRNIDFHGSVLLASSGMQKTRTHFVQRV